MILSEFFERVEKIASVVLGYVHKYYILFRRKLLGRVPLNVERPTKTISVKKNKE